MVKTFFLPQASPRNEIPAWLPAGSKRFMAAF
jgi:hypothetical protein